MSGHYRDCQNDIAVFYVDRWSLVVVRLGMTYAGPLCVGRCGHAH